MLTMLDALAQVAWVFLKNMSLSRRNRQETAENKTRRSKPLRAENIQIIEEQGYPSLSASGLEYRRACTATIDGVPYQFRFVLKHNAFDGSKYTDIPNDSWIEITGPSNDDPNRIITTRLDYFSEPPRWSTAEKAWKPVAVKQAVREWLSVPQAHKNMDSLRN